MKIEYRRTSADNPDFQQLVAALNAELALRDGDDHAFYQQFNQSHSLPYCLVAYDAPSGQALGCGALRPYTDNILEIKRMYVPEEQRNRGIATAVLHALEAWARELEAEKCILETGIRQPEAIALYEKNGYRRMPNYGQYANVENSVCFEKTLA